MPLNKVKGNMYDWVTHTWNTVKGACPHGCHYCYMKRWGEQKAARFDEKELNTDLGNGNFIFVGSSCDLFADDIPIGWITDTISVCDKHQWNTYFFQTKNPYRIWRTFLNLIPWNSVICTTIESNRQYKEMGNSPSPTIRAKYLEKIEPRFRTMVTVEPVMDFDLDKMVGLINSCEPEQVNIGANTNRQVKLPEPSADKIKALVESIEPFTRVKLKPNLKRITG